MRKAFVCVVAALIPFALPCVGRADDPKSKTTGEQPLERFTLKGLYWIKPVALTADGKTLAYGRSAVRFGDGAVVVVDATTGQEKHLLTGHSWGLEAVTFSPDGKLLASGSSDRNGMGEIKLWNVATGQLLRTLSGHPGGILTLAFSPDGKVLASGSMATLPATHPSSANEPDGDVRLWDAATGRALQTLGGHKGRVYSVAFSPDGQTLASADSGGSIHLWEPATGRQTGTLPVHARGVAFSPDSRTLSSASRDIKLWDLATRKEIRTFAGHADLVYSVAFSADGRRLVSGSADQTIRIWDVATGKTLAALKGHRGPVWSLALAGDGKVLASAGCTDQTVKLWDLLSLSDK